MKREPITITLILAAVTLFAALNTRHQFRETLASPYTNVDENTAFKMITNGSYPNILVLDVRSQAEYDSGHIYRATWIPHIELNERIEELMDHREKETIVYCRTGVRSVAASEILDSNNFTKVYNMLGGIESWQSNGLPTWISTVHNLDTAYNYDTIQESIDASQTLHGHTILVSEGIYYENVIVSKSISLIAENRESTILSGNGTGKVLHLLRSATNITGFSIRESGGYPGGACVFLDNVTGCSVSTNLINNSAATSLDCVGIYLNSSDSNTIIGNVVLNNGIGMNIVSSSDNTVEENHIENAHLGIQIPFSSNNNAIFGNHLTNCDYGISLDHASTKNTVSQNHVELSSTAGVAIETASNNNSILANTIETCNHGIRILWASGNSFHHNNMINNSIQAYVTPGYANEWNSSYPSGGNYWSNYIGEDLHEESDQKQPGSDGIGDTPRTIDSSNVDSYPLMGEWFDFKETSELHFQTVCNSTISDFSFNGTVIRFNAAGENGTNGFCRILIPAVSMNGPYAVFVNNTEIPHTLLLCSNSTHSYMYFVYDHSTREITIVTEQAILQSLLCALGAVTALLVLRGRKSRHTRR